MLGERDSEVCVLFEDTVMIDAKMDGKPYSVGEFCHRLRCYVALQVYSVVAVSMSEKEFPNGLHAWKFASFCEVEFRGY